MSRLRIRCHSMLVKLIAPKFVMLLGFVLVSNKHKCKMLDFVVVGTHEVPSSDYGEGVRNEEDEASV
ncbi:hypothetical protein Tco_0925917 [Tanacetum coccineum]|uniref:Uncharacterized protein n=1 Tax=Tanacetum coccineum TaxID=301880 RepID=A0ABQ5D938_9ASTR